MEDPKGYGKSIIGVIKYHFLPFIVFVLIGLSFVVFVQQQTGRQLFGHDISLMGYGEIFMEDVMANGHLPYWNPYIFCGMPHMAAMNAATMFVPTSLVLHLMKLSLPIYFLFGVSITISLSGFFMYLFVQGLGVSRLTGVISGVFFALCGSFVSYINPGHDVMMFSNAMIPLVFFFLNKGAREDKLVYYVLTGCMLGIQSMATMYQVVLYTAICLTAYFSL